jgi:hypothetical protein
MKKYLLIIIPLLLSSCSYYYFDTPQEFKASGLREGKVLNGAGFYEWTYSFDVYSSKWYSPNSRWRDFNRKATGSNTQTFEIGDSYYKFVPASEEAEQWIQKRRREIAKPYPVDSDYGLWMIDKYIDEDETYREYNN